MSRAIGWRRRSGTDDGMALVMVLGTMVFLTLFLLTALAYAMASAVPSRGQQDAKAAIAAAQAGVDEYIARLNADNSYWTRGNTDPANQAFSAAGRFIQGTGGTGATYRYQVLTAPADIARNGRIQLQVTGESSPGNGTRSVTRTVTATLEPKGFLNYVYFSDIEVIDPALMPASYLQVTRDGRQYPPGQSSRRYAMRPMDGCGLYYYTGRSPSGFTVSGGQPATVGLWSTSANSWYSAPGSVTSGTIRGLDAVCEDIQWATGDVVNGALHSNDALQVNGSVAFTSPETESSWPYCQSNPSANCWWGSGTPSSAGYRPKYAKPMAMPAGNENLKAYVESDPGDPAPQARPGCYYTGATKITFNGTSMTVYSPNTTSAPSRCLNTADRANPQTIATIPPVIYVDAQSGACTGVGYPASYTVGGSTYTESTTAGTTTDYSCNRGTAFVSGTLNGQVTVASLDDIVITGDLRYATGTTGTDVLGLVAGNYVWVYHPITSGGTNLSQLVPSQVRNVHTINAAVLSLRHSFIVQNWNKGAKLSTGSAATKLNVTGSIAQKFRGPVGTGSTSSLSTGYLKNYVYDARLKVLQPPFFLKPDTSPWEVSALTDK